MFSSKITTTCLIGVVVRAGLGWACAAGVASAVASTTVPVSATSAEAMPKATTPRRLRALLGLVPPVGGGGTRLADERLSEVDVGPGDPRQHEEVAAPERGDVVGEALVCEPFLRRLELPRDVLLVAGEHQAHVEVARTVDTAVVVVATTQDPAGVGVRRAWVRPADVAGQRGQRAGGVGVGGGD